MFYEVYAMDDEKTPDLLRKELHDALHTLSYDFRDYPTLPADPCNSMKEFPSSRSKEAALLLPSKHCAFRGCSWCGTDSASQIDHLLDEHESNLQDAMVHYNALRPNGLQDKRVLAISIYNEGIAMAIRRGAPLASYSIDRRCLNEYMKKV